jgi:hypothetical protein
MLLFDSFTMHNNDLGFDESDRIFSPVGGASGLTHFSRSKG